MSRLPIQDTQTATGSNKEIFDQFQKALGVVPNLVKVMANSPQVLKSYAQFNGALSTGKLSGAIREQIALLTAEANSCTYCLSAHTALGKMVGLNQSQIDAARNAEAADARTQAALTFAQAVLANRGGVGQADIDAVRAAGFSDAELAEIVGAVALNVLTNYFNRAFDVDVDFPRVEPRQTAAAV